MIIDYKNNWERHKKSVSSFFTNIFFSLNAFLLLCWHKFLNYFPKYVGTIPIIYTFNFYDTTNVVVGTLEQTVINTQLTNCIIIFLEHFEVAPIFFLFICYSFYDNGDDAGKSVIL